MTDKELLEYAAEAAGYPIKTLSDIYPNHPDEQCPEGEVAALIDGEWEWWNPLTDDGDALRLAVKLSQLDGGVALMLNSRLNCYQFAQCITNENVVAPQEYMTDDPYAATRRAITRAAAEIGRTM